MSLVAIFLPAGHGFEQLTLGDRPRINLSPELLVESPEHHEKRVRAYAEFKGREIVAYRLDADSGKAVVGHPEAQRMLGDIREGRIPACNPNSMSCASLLPPKRRLCQEPEA